MKKYQSYKSTGIEWIGDVPEHWENRKFKWDVFYQEGPGLRTFQFTEKGIRVICVSNITDKGIDFETTHTRHISNEEYEEKYKHFTVENNDILLSSSGSIGKVCKYYFDGEPVILNTSTIRIHSKNSNKYYDEFVKYVLSSNYVQLQLRFLMTGGIVSNFGPSHLDQIFNYLPPLQEQLQIVQFLDSKTELIDKLISTKERKITLLKEQRTSLINQVVTKGLNPNVKLKDSGVEWIGEIPETWKTIKLGYISRPVQGIQLDVEKQLHEKIENSERFIRISDYTMDEEPRYMNNFPVNCLVNEDDLVMVRYGSKSGKVYRGIKGVICNNVFRIELSSDLSNDFCYYFLNQDLFYNEIEKNRDNTTLPQVSHGLYKEMKITLPSLSEQLQIVEFLDEKTIEIDDMVHLEQKKIDLLKEYRQSLISEVVTGKIKVTTDE